MKKYDNSLYFDISTFLNLKNCGDKLINIVNIIYEDIISKYTMNINAGIQQSDNDIHYEYGKDNKKIIELFLSGEIDHILIRNKSNEEIQKDYYNPAIALSITCNYNERNREFGYDYDIPDNIAFSISERLINKNVIKDLQNNIVTIFKKIFIELNGIVGFITKERINAKIIPNETTLESLLNLYYYSHSQYFATIARGYFWANMISEGHIQKLGGNKRISEESPCVLNEFLDFDNRHVLYMQLTEDINKIDDVKLQELKYFLKSVLPEEDSEIIKRNDPSGKAREWSRLFFDFYD